MTEHEMSRGEAQARRLEAMLEKLEAAFAQPAVSNRARNAPGENEWNALQTLGHLIEIVPFWLNHCVAVSQAQGEPRPYGRPLDSPERLEGVEHGTHGDLDSLLAEFREEVRQGAATIRGFSETDLDKVGNHNRLGHITVTATIDVLILEHGEAHVEQIKTALGA